MKLYLPTRLITGPGAVREHAPLLRAYGDRCLLVTGGGASKRCGALEDMCAALDSQGISWELYDEIRPNPDLASCVRGGRRAADLGARFIVGVGGGSPLDAAKAVAVAAANPELDGEGLYSMDWPRPPLPVVLVGTTAGTGSEVTPVAVITDGAGRKRSFRGDSMFAALAFGDPAYTATMPLEVTASTGVDALAHCLESYFHKKANEISRAFALRGIELLLPPLRRVAEGELPDLHGREILYDASILGGMAISVTGTCMPHNLGYYLTEAYNIPHGFACAAFLPALLRHAADCALEETESLCRRVGVGVEALCALIQALTPPLELDITPAEVERVLPRWETAAAIRNTIGDVTTDQVRRIWLERFCGGGR